MRGTIICDHLGNEYPSKREMCRKYNIDHSTFNGRIQRGMSLKNALLAPSERTGRKTTDHTGREFASEAEMCRYYGIRQDTYRLRIKKGYSVKDALIINRLNPGSDWTPVIKDHTGKEWCSEKEMCRNYGVSQQSFRKRLQTGMTVEEALMLGNSYAHAKKEREGQKKKMHNGQWCTIVEYISCNNCTVRFEDGTVREHIKYVAFQRGAVKNPNMKQIKHYEERIGREHVMQSGQTCKIIRYGGCYDIDVMFEDGNVAKNRSWNQFLKGLIKNPSVYDRTGETRIQNCGMEATIIRYGNAKDIDVKFNDGTVSEHRTYVEFKRGSLHPDTRVKYVDRIGETFLFSCGLKGTITNVVSDKCYVTFEDGAVSDGKSYFSIRKGTAAHPVLSSLTTSRYMGFECMPLFTSNHKRLKVNGIQAYMCRCQTCGYQDILTPQEMITHQEMHNEEGGNI